MSNQYMFTVGINKAEKGPRNLQHELDAITVYYSSLYGQRMTKGQSLLAMFNEIEYRHKEIVPMHKEAHE